MRSAEAQSVGPLDQRLRSTRRRNVVGRAPEREAFRAALDTGAPGVLYLQGPAGSGKSTLLQIMADEARDAGRRVVQLDGRAAVTGRPLPEQVGPVVHDEDAVLLVDAFEHLHEWEPWLAEHLPARGALVVLAGRSAPEAARWSGAGRALRVMPLGELSAADSLAVLRQHGVPTAWYGPLLTRVGGHPLALRLAAAAVTDQAPDVPPRHGLPREVTDTLLAQLVGDVPSPTHRHALEACAIAMTTTEEVLRAALPDPGAAAEMFTWLSGLSFVRPVRLGIRPHDLVRDLLDHDHRWRDPEGHRQTVARIRAALADRALGAADDPDVLKAVAELCFLHRRTAPPGYVTGDGDDGVIESTLRPDDVPRLVRMTADREGEASAALVTFWLRRRPEAFRVYRRSEDGEAIAFMAWLRLAAPDPVEISTDPVVAAAWAYAQAAAPLRPGEHLSVGRFAVDPAAYQRPSAVSELVQLRITAEWLHDDRTAWSFSVLADARFWGPLMAYLDQTPLPGTVAVGTRAFTLYAHDWRAVPPDAWLVRDGEQLWSGPLPPSATSPRARLAVLSRPEFDAAVRHALRDWRQPDRLAGNPLTASRIASGGPSDDAVETLRQVISATVAELGKEPRHARFRDAITVTFFRGVPAQRVAADLLRLPFSTYRRHLTDGIDLLCERLWRQELR